MAYMLGVSLFSEGKNAEALEPLKRAKQLIPADLNTRLFLGAVLERLGRTTEAEEEWRNALAIDANSSTALDSLSSELIDVKDFLGVVLLLDRPNLIASRTELQYLNLGTALASLYRLNDAIKILREGLIAFPDSLLISNKLAMVLLLTSQPDEALALFERTLQQHPGDMPTAILYLRTMILKRSESAYPFASEMLRSHPDRWEVLYLNAVLETRQGKYREARAHLEHSIAMNPSSGEAHAELGKTLAELGELSSAKRELEKALALGGGQSDARYQLGRVLHALGDSEGSKKQIDLYKQLKSTSFARSHAATQAVMGDDAMKVGDAKRAIECYRAALDSAPDEAVLHFKLAMALDKTSDMNGEKLSLEHAVELQPDFPEPLNQLGYLANRASKPSEAEDYFRAAIKASPSYVLAWVNLAATLASEAKWQETQKAIDRILELDPQNDQARLLRQAITKTQ